MFCSFLASGDSYGGLGARFQIAASTVSQIIPEVCDNCNLRSLITNRNDTNNPRKVAGNREWLWKMVEFSQLCEGHRQQACCDTEPSQRRQFVP